MHDLPGLHGLSGLRGLHGLRGPPGLRGRPVLPGLSGLPGLLSPGFGCQVTSSHHIFTSESVTFKFGSPPSDFV